MKTIRYQKMQKMQPREGVKYSTTYLKQTLDQRRELVKHVHACIRELAQAIEADSQWDSFIDQPLKGFPTTQGRNRSLTDILTDMNNEAQGKTRQGLPKDFALAPIERWNKLFEGTDYEIHLVQTYGATATNFDKLMEFTDV